MADASLSQLFASLHEDIQHQLALVRKSFGHPVSKGDASEEVWLGLLRTYLPQRYQAEKAFVVDSKGTFSDQIDVVIFDRQYSPFIFTYKGETYIPAESVYAVFEAKQTINAGLVDYAQTKVASVRSLYRTSLPIPYANGVYPAKAPIEILGGILTLESEWRPPMGDPLRRALEAGTGDRQLNLGCIASHGHFARDRDTGAYAFNSETRAATAFLFALISRLQFSGTVPMIDVDAYAEWLVK